MKSLLSLAVVLLCSLSLASAQQKVTILPVELKPAAVPPGASVKFTYHFDAVPMDQDYTVFVHVEDAKHAMVLQNDHQPPFPIRTSSWNGKISYTMNVGVPASTPDGNYPILAGLYGKNGRQPLLAGEGVKEVGGNTYQIGTLVVDRTAPVPPLDSDKPATLDTTGYKMTFHDEFDNLRVTAWGPIEDESLWIAHTPYRGDFGDASFTDPGGPNTPFFIENGMLKIRAYKKDGKWYGGLISSLDPYGSGFAQQYGYFEMRAKFPKGPGTWPAFWLSSSNGVTKKGEVGFEIDIVEQYGHAPQSLCSTIHWWYPDSKDNKGVGYNATVKDMSDDFHNYGFLWDEKEMIWYFDGVEIWRQPTPTEAKTPMYVMINLAMGSGWPIKDTPNPSDMLVDYVRVYSKDPNAKIDKSVAEEKPKP